MRLTHNPTHSYYNIPKTQKSRYIHSGIFIYNNSCTESIILTLYWSAQAMLQINRLPRNNQRRWRLAILGHY